MNDGGQNYDQLPDGGQQQVDDIIAVNRGPADNRTTYKIPLGPAFTTADRQKLDGIAPGATATGLTTTQIRQIITEQAGAQVDDLTRLATELLVTVGTPSALTGAWVADTARGTNTPVPANAFISVRFDAYDPLIVDTDDIRAVQSADAGDVLTDTTSTARALHVNGAPAGLTLRVGHAGGNAIVALSADGNYVLSTAAITQRTGGTGAGLSAAEVDARIAAGVLGWARAGNADVIPDAKLPASAKRPAPTLAGLGGLTQGEVDTRVAAGVEDWAQTGNSGLIPEGKLPTPASLGLLTGPQVIAEINSRIRTDAEINAVINANSTVLGLAEFEAHLRDVTALATGVSVTYSVRNVAVAVPGPVALPEAADGRQISISVAASGEPTGARTVDLADILALPPVEAAETMNSGNSITFSNPPDNNRYYLGRNAAGDFMFGSDTADTYTLTLTDDRINVTPYVTFPSGTGGVSAEEATTIAHAAVTAGVSAWALAANTDPIPANKLTNAPSGGARATSELIALAAAPATAGKAVGAIDNVGGDLLELVDDEADANVLRGTAAADGDYVGARANITGQADVGSFADPALVAEFEWRPTTEGVLYRARFSRAALGASPPATIYPRFTDTTGRSDLTETLTRNASADTAEAYAYQSDTSGARIDAPAGTVFAVHFWSDRYDGSTPVKVHSADRWENWVHRKIARPTQSEVYQRAKAIIKAGNAITVTTSDADQSITVASSAAVVPSGNTFPTNPAPSTGDRFQLLVEQTAPFPATITPAQSGTAYGWFAGEPGQGHIDLPATGIDFVLWYENTAEVPQAQRGRIRIGRTSGNARTPTSIVIGGTSRTLTAVGVGSPHFWQTAVVAANPLTAGVERSVQVNYSDGSKEWPDKVFEPHEYAWDGFKWRRSSTLSAGDIRDELQTLTGDARLSAEYIRDLPARRFEEVLMDGPGTGLAITNTNNNVTTSLVLFDPAFDLDEVNQGEVHIEATLTIGTSDDATIGFGTRTLQRERLVDILFASTLKGGAVWADGGTLEGEEVADPVQLYKGSAELGSLSLRLARNSAGQLGYVFAYTGAGNAGNNLSVGINITAAWSPTDAAPASAPTAGSITPFRRAATPSGNVDLTESTANQWTNWTAVATTTALSSAEAGNGFVFVRAALTGRVQADATDGADRIQVEARILKIPSSGAPTFLGFLAPYGPRHINTFWQEDTSDPADGVNNADSASNVWRANGILDDPDPGAGDTYRVEVRIILQAAGSETVRFEPGNTENVIAVQR